MNICYGNYFTSVRCINLYKIYMFLIPNIYIYTYAHMIVIILAPFIFKYVHI